MTGAAAATAGGATAGAGTGTPGTPVWGNIYAASGGATNLVALSGITGALNVSATNSGGSMLGYSLNGVNSSYAGAFAWPEGQELGWYLIGPGAGTVTVSGPSGELASFTYSILNSRTGGFSP